jgi:ABC-type uncharacterized transport system auxiliary subunit
MRTLSDWCLRGVAAAAVLMLAGCAAPPTKKLYMLNYEPESLSRRMHHAPYPFTIRVKEFDIEKAYDRFQITYRHSPFELPYYFYHVWAVKPTPMLTDLVHKHLVESKMVSQVVRRLDEALDRPDFEISGTIEAIEEYDSDEVWFAHLALRLKVIRLRDNRTVYLRRFDKRKRVHKHEPEFVVRELSQIMDLIMTQALHDIDVVLAREYGVAAPGEPNAAQALDTTTVKGEDE